MPNYTDLSTDFLDAMMDARDDFMPSFAELPLHTQERKDMRKDFYASFCAK